MHLVIGVGGWANVTCSEKRDHLQKWYCTRESPTFSVESYNWLSVNILFV